MTLTFDIWLSDFQKRLQNRILKIIFGHVMTSHQQQIFLDGKKFFPGRFQWSYGPKTAFSTIFGYVVPLTFWPISLKFSIMKNCIPTSQLSWQNFTPNTFGWSYSSKSDFIYHVWSCCELDLWPLSLKIFTNCYTLPWSVFYSDCFFILTLIFEFLTPKI